MVKTKIGKCEECDIENVKLIEHWWSCWNGKFVCEKCDEMINDNIWYSEFEDIEE